MIIDTWGIKTTKRKGIRKSLYCYKVDIDMVLSKKLKGYKVRYKCDNSFCKNPDKIHSTTSSSLINAKWNNVESQMCRSCRTIKSEREIKKVIIPFSNIKKELIDEGYKVLTKSKEYYNGYNQSQFPIKVICNNEHKYYVTWNNWSKGKRCRVCYEKEKYNNAVKYMDGYMKYNFDVRSLTEKTYEEHKNIIDPNNLRSIDYCLDHKYSIYQGFKDCIPVNIMSSVNNLEMLSRLENSRKNYNCSITKEDLFNEYIR